MGKWRVILVTDGDDIALEAVQVAARNVGCRCISASAGNPTVLSGQDIVNLIKQAEYDPVVVMVDDRGKKGIGPGEQAMEIIAGDEDIHVLGVVAVSSNGKDCNGLKITCSITKDAAVIDGAVDKYGSRIESGKVCGDTLSVLRGMKIPVIVGIGDPGKMDFNDEISKGAPVTTKALQEILNRSGFSR